MEKEQSYAAEGQGQEATERRANRATESGPEDTEENLIHGAEMLETPSDGSFLHGLQLFVAWVQSLITPPKKDD